MLKKWMSSLIVLMLVFSLAACGTNKGNSASNGSDQSQGSSQGDSSKASNGQSNKSKITLKIIHWKNQAANDFLKNLNKEFEAKYPNISVEYTVVPSTDYRTLEKTRVTAQDVDLIANLQGLNSIPSWAKGAQKPAWQQWADAGMLADLSNEPFLKNYNAQDVKNGGGYNGKIYGVTTGKVSFTGLYYNKDIFAKYQLKVPTTFNELINVSKTLQSKGVAPIGFAGKDVWPFNLAVQGLSASVIPNQLQYIKGLWSGETHFTDPVNVEVLTKAQELMNYAIKGFTGIGYGQLPGLFASGKVAMIADGTWDAPTIAKANPNLKFGYFPIPGNDDAKYNQSLAGKYDMTWMVASHSKNKDAALKYLAFFSDPKNYADYANAVGFLPVQPNVQMKSSFLAGLAPYIKHFNKSWDQLFVDRKDEGEHIKQTSIHAELLKPWGPVATPQQLANLQQKEWEAAAPK